MTSRKIGLDFFVSVWYPFCITKKEVYAAKTVD